MRDFEIVGEISEIVTIAPEPAYVIALAYGNRMVEGDGAARVQNQITVFGFLR